MTTESPSHRSASGPSIHVVRARKLLLGGLAGGVAAAIVCLIIFAVLDGSRGLASAGLGAGMVLFFYAIGQLVMVRFADAGARTLMLVSMASYVGRVIILGLILLIFSQQTGAWEWLHTKTLFIGAIAVVAGWILVEIIVFSRLRIGIYDEPYQGPSEHPDDDDEDEGDADVDENDGTASDAARTNTEHPGGAR
ncbi:hypothetical protein [Microlunatus soli]|uniref:ATP synthase protein I n=1 Tax=Microlunatus soli TaxID=630515 RepID=A0A1H1ZVE0_9ACTN|nr:hypothetical protein [Microlunatus soli]SDT37559.1 hypothetical protein SAMN04489812_5474 [Microlunatus soli]